MASEIQTEEDKAESTPDRRKLLDEAFTEAEAISDEPQLALDDKERDQKGKFVAKEDKPELEASTDQKIEDKPEVDTEEPIWKRPPQSWKSEYHETWKMADPRLQEYAYQREEEMRKGVEPLISKAKFADEMQQAIEPFMSTINGLGIRPSQAARALMQADHTLRHAPPEQKVQLFAQLAQQYGVNLGDVAPFQTEAPSPHIAALQNEVLGVRGQLQNYQNEHEQTKQTKLLEEIEIFAKDKEYFEEARPTMVTLLQSGFAATLDDAYDKAVRLDPELFEKVAKGSQAKDTIRKSHRADKAAKAAKAAAVSVKTSTPGQRTTTNAQDRRSMLIEQFDNISERL